jgi:hypothetical protein
MIDLSLLKHLYAKYFRQGLCFIHGISLSPNPDNTWSNINNKRIISVGEHFRKNIILWINQKSKRYGYLPVMISWNMMNGYG